MHENFRRKKSKSKTYHKREPKRIDVSHVFGFCGMCCCGPYGTYADYAIKVARKKEEQRAIAEMQE